MQLSDEAEFMEKLTSMAELHNKTLSPNQLEIYWNALASFELADIIRALGQHTRNPDGGQFMPKPADIIKLLMGGGQSKAQLAWSKVHKAMGQIGSGQTVVFDDPLIHAVIVDMEGWIKLCQTDDKALPFRARDFEQRYAAYLLKPPQTYPKQLSGWIEQHNSAHNFPEHIPEVRLVGDTQKALMVQASGCEPERCYQIQEQLEALSVCHALSNAVDDEVDTHQEPRAPLMLEANP